MSEETLSPEELVREVQELRAQAKEQEDRLLRARAELENQRKRGAREMDDARKYALQKFVRVLLPVKDSLEQGLEAVTAEDEAQALREGICGSTGKPAIRQALSGSIEALVHTRPVRT